MAGYYGALRRVCVFALAVSAAQLSGCGDSGSFDLLGNPLFRTSAPGRTTAPTPGGDTGGGGSNFGGGSRATVDPCTEPQERKFVRISLRNIAQDDFIHYFLVLVAYVNGETYPDGAVCEDDIDLYTTFGYTLIPDGSTRVVGNFCIPGPALFYFHENGQFQSASAGGDALASAIGPAQGTNATFDRFFSSAGAQTPVPNTLLWHNPGTGEGAALKISVNIPNPCSIVVGLTGESDCAQDAFYYVDSTDQLNGSAVLGAGSGRRTPNEIQGTGCVVSGGDDAIGTQAVQTLAPSGASASNANDSEFLRGGFVEFVFLREDRNPPVPQLVWRVLDQSGSVASDFDPRVDIP